MPDRPWRPCNASGCHRAGPWYNSRGRCPEHARQVERERSARRRSNEVYGRHWKTRVRLQFVQQLVAAGVPPLCGASLPGVGPDTLKFSRCRQEGLHTPGEHVDHDPPLTDQERDLISRGYREALADPHRLSLLCAVCHGAKSQREQQESAGYPDV